MNHKLLIYLAKKTGIYSEIDTSTSKIAKDTGFSQQSVSRILVSMEKEDFLRREVSAKGMKINLNKKAFDYLREEYKLLSGLFRTKKTIEGTLFSGIGEGKFYIKKYEKQIEKALKFKPYLGTLNLRVKADEVKAFTSDLNPLIIPEFKTKNRSYGKITLFEVFINGVEAGIIFPDRTIHHDDVLEIIGPSYFRKLFKLKEGDKVKIGKERKGKG